MSATITPFCIHIRTVEDANFLMSALLERLSGEPPAITFKEHMQCLELHIAASGIEAGVKAHFSAGRDAGTVFPSFIEPALIHCLTSLTELPDITHEED